MGNDMYNEEQLADARYRALHAPPVSYFDVVFDGPPGPVAGRFVECENECGASISIGEWVHRPDGCWALRIPCSCPIPPASARREGGEGRGPMADDKLAGKRINEAIALAVQYGSTDGSHHKMWVIDQMVRALTGDGYSEFVRAARAGEDGPDTYEWDEGIPP